MNPPKFRTSGTELMIDKAFAKEPELGDRLIDMIHKDRGLDGVFMDIAVYIMTKARHLDEYIEIEPQFKKRKILGDDAPPTAGPVNLAKTALLEKEVSFAMPLRKKLKMEISRYGVAGEPTTTYAISARPKMGLVDEFEMKLDKFKYAMILPVPEKAQKQFNYCIIPDSGAEQTAEPIVWTVNENDVDTLDSFRGEIGKLAADFKGEKFDDNKIHHILGYVLNHHDIELVTPSQTEFVSAVPESHRKGEKTYHVKAHRGSKDGYLFFLRTGIFFGFKKPLVFYALDEIEAISYTSVLQRTFNLNISYKSHGSDEVQEVEFSMLDQADFAGIDGYVKKHQLQDASMAEARRAKIQKSNGTKSRDTNGDADDHRTELEKAQQQMEEEEVDEEDELEEDYDPEDEDSGASGSGSDDDDYEYDMPTRKRNLVAEELGSEAEDVEVTDEEEDNDEGHKDADGDEEEEEDAEEENEVVEQRPAKVHALQTITHSQPSQHTDGGPGLDDEDQL